MARMRLLRSICCMLLAWRLEALPYDVPSARKCEGYQNPKMLCMMRYNTVLPSGFNRTVIDTVGDTDTYGSTKVPNDPSFRKIGGADFLVWDLEKAKVALGSDPQVEFLHRVLGQHEGPVYVPSLNQLYFSTLSPDATAQTVLDLNHEPPTVHKTTANPPLQLPAGAAWYQGQILWGGSAVPKGDPYTSGLYTQNVTTGDITPLLNNYDGYRFTTIDDVAVSPNGDIWFTDNWYSLGLGFMKEPQLEPAIWRFNPDSGLVQIVDDSFTEPNGMHFSPDGSEIYITDGDADHVDVQSGEIVYRSYNKRTLYACTISPDGTSILNKRAIYLSTERLPDGLKVAENGYIATATGYGVDVLTSKGEPIVRIQTNFTVLNLAWAGTEYDSLYLVGVDGVSRVKWNLKGMKSQQ